MVPSSSSEHPTEVSLCHCTTKPVTTEPMGTLPVMVIVVSVTLGDELRVGDGNGTAEYESMAFSVLDIVDN